MSNIDAFDAQDEIAVIGLACRLPGANNPDEFWQNLCDGVESITFLSEQELRASGVALATLSDPHYVKAAAILEGIDLFDAAFFGFTPREAEIMDPQHRVFLECAWEALESAGYATDTYAGRVGVYAGTSVNSYLLSHLQTSSYLIRDDHFLRTMIGNEKAHLATQTSYKLNLKGPGVSVSTACSTSLVAIHLACQSLLNGECDISLAGGVCIRIPQKVGYTYVEGGIASPDGHCRTFDAEAQGTVGGSGAGVVVLKRLEDALADGDYIHAVVKGSAINNDGSRKVGYTAPSVTGQAEVIAEAQAIAGISPEAVTYIEAHGAGTSLGDPIEIAALTKVFRAKTPKKQFCAIGSVKTNIGHLDAAAGVIGFIKTVMALKQKLLPPSLHFEQPNPAIDFEESPFYVNTMLSRWQTTPHTPRRAGVSAFGIGGTNAHVILEEAPFIEETPGASPSDQLVVLSAKTEASLRAATARLGAYLSAHPDLNLADVAYTLQVGRKEFPYRRYLVGQNAGDVARTLVTSDSLPVAFVDGTQQSPGVLFLLPGQQLQEISVAQRLYQQEALFRKYVEECAKLLEVHLGFDIRTVLFPNKEQREEAARQLQQIVVAQSALFVVEYALAQLWMNWGVRPEAMIGYDLGEYVAACLAGVLSLTDVLTLVVAQGKLMQALPAGAMLAVALAEEDIQPFLGPDISLAATHSATECVLSGSLRAIERLEKQCAQADIASHRLSLPCAAHSFLLDPLLERFDALLEQITFNTPKIPYISNVTGTWITAQDVTHPNYWKRHLCGPLRLAEGLRALLRRTTKVMLELGPEGGLLALARKQPDLLGRDRLLLPSLQSSQDERTDLRYMLDVCGRLWSVGISLNWQRVSASSERRRVPLPTYTFERERYWLPEVPQTQAAPITQGVTQRKIDFADWFSLPSWKRSAPVSYSKRRDSGQQKQCWLVFVGKCGISDQIVERLKQARQDVVTVEKAEKWSKRSELAYALNPQKESDYIDLFSDLHALNRLPDMIVHLWNVSGPEPTEHEALREHQEIGFYSLLFLVQAFGKQESSRALQIRVISDGVQDVESQDPFCPEKSPLLGACKVIPQEYGQIVCQNIDIVLPGKETGNWEEAKLLKQIMDELFTLPLDPLIAYRGNYRWVPTFEPVHLEPSVNTTRLREKGVYLITGGLGFIGLMLARWLAQSVQARLILTGRSGLPAKDTWDNWLATHDDGDYLSNRIRKVKELEEIGAEVLVLSADVADEDQMQEVIAQSTRRFGALHGVIHAAGVVEKELFLPVSEMDRSNCEQHFRPKVYGLRVLEKVLQGQPLDFCLLLSSLAALLGGVSGFLAYTAANIFIDACSRKLSREQRIPWISVDLDARGTTEETIRAFQLILSGEAHPQVVVSTEFKLWLDVPHSWEAENAPGNAVTLHSRPDLREQYVAARNEMEQQIADIWQEVLGIDKIGINDNFFDLGGSSLMIIQIIRQMQAAFQVVLSMQLVFDHPTIASLAQAVVEKQIESVGAEQLAELLQKVDQILESDTNL